MMGPTTNMESTRGYDSNYQDRRIVYTGHERRWVLRRWMVEYGAEYARHKHDRAGCRTGNKNKNGNGNAKSNGKEERDV